MPGCGGADTFIMAPGRFRTVIGTDLLGRYLVLLRGLECGDSLRELWKLKISRKQLDVGP